MIPEPIEMPFGMPTRMGPRNHIGLLDGVQFPRRKGQFLGRKVAADCKQRSSQQQFGVMRPVGDVSTMQ